MYIGRVLFYKTVLGCVCMDTYVAVYIVCIID